MSDAGLFIIGLSHHQTRLDLREAFALPEDALPSVLGALRAAGVPEAMVLSTCNRIEVYGTGDDEAALRAEDVLRARGQREASFHRLAAQDAVRHAFRVATGLDSQVLGETQILGQLKRAYEAADEAGALGPTLRALRDSTFGVAKRIRSRTGIGRHAVSVAHVAVEVALKVFGDLRGRPALLIGAGRMCRLAAERLAKEGARLVVASRTLERAAELAGPMGGTAVPLSSLRDELARADVVVSGTGCPGFVLAREDVEQARQARDGRPLVVVDIALPRDVEPEVRRLPRVFLYDLDDLRAVADANLRERRREAAGAEALVETEARAFCRRQRERTAVPLLVALRRHGDEIVSAELDRARQRLGPLDPDQERALHALASAIANKLLHAPTVALKQMASEGRVEGNARLVRSVLGLA